MRLVFDHLKSQHYYAKEILGFFFIILGLYFLLQHKQEFSEVKATLDASRPIWMIVGLVFVALYVAFQSFMYMASFKSVGSQVSFRQALVLFLKRNLVSVFLPGGGFTSLVFFSKEIEKAGVSKTKINFASYIYGVVGILTLILIAIPIIAYLALTNQRIGGEWEAIIGLSLLTLLIVWLSISLYKKQRSYRFLIRYFPNFENVIDEMRAGSVSRKWLLITIMHSLLIEVIGIFHLYIALQALGLPASLTASAIGYVIATLFLCISPFMRGMGAVEISMVLVLSQFGLSSIQALSVTFLYRFFEFWLPLILGLVSFVFQKGNVFLRIFPSILLFALGAINIASVLTPALAQRMRILHQFIPSDAIRFSTIMILLIGVLLIVCSAFLLKGLRNAWFVAMTLSVLSLFGHLVKAIDYEESLLALFSIITLSLTYKQYYIKRAKHIRYFSIHTALLLILSIFIYGSTGFYYLKAAHFLDDFTLGESIMNTFACMVLLDTTYLEPHTAFANYFVYSLNFFGVITLSLLFYAFIRPYIWVSKEDDQEQELAQQYIRAYGNSSCDYFKIAKDKQFYFADGVDGFIAYRVASSYAVVLHEPVCADDASRKQLIHAFESFCKDNSLRILFYRIDRSRLAFYEALGWKSLPIGQEALVTLREFRLDGKDRKSMRNALNSVEKRGFTPKIYEAPIKDGLLQKLRAVSDQWLESMEREEIVFSQGMFDESELKNHTIITLENEDERVIAFLNVIPNYQSGEITYDLIRKVDDAPGGSMDALIVNLIEYGKSHGYLTLNMGLAPFSGLEKSGDIPERTIHFAYEKLPRFKQYKGLRDFKDKFNPVWETRYLVFYDYYDLLRAPLALNKVVKPKNL